MPIPIPIQNDQPPKKNVCVWHYPMDPKLAEKVFDPQNQTPNTAKEKVLLDPQGLKIENGCDWLCAKIGAPTGLFEIGKMINILWGYSLK